MTKGELISYLEDYDDDCEVRIMSQENWPFENSISHVISNEELYDEEEDYDYGEEEEKEKSDGKDFDGSRRPMNRIFIVEGKQLCYGTKNAWRR